MYKVGDIIIRTKVNPSYTIPLGTVAIIQEVRDSNTYMVDIQTIIHGSFATRKVSWWSQFFSLHEPETKIIWEV